MLAPTRTPPPIISPCFMTTSARLQTGGEPVSTGNFGSVDAVKKAGTTRTVRVSFGWESKSVPDLTVVTHLPHPMNTDTDGLVPTSLFKSVFISSRAGFVILNPTFPKTSR